MHRLADTDINIAVMDDNQYLPISIFVKKKKKVSEMIKFCTDRKSCIFPLFSKRVLLPNKKVTGLPDNTSNQQWLLKQPLQLVASV